MKGEVFVRLPAPFDEPNINCSSGLFQPFFPPTARNDSNTFMPKVFATGVTGYIGGDALYAIANTHPECDITCLVRNSDKGAQVAKEYPKFKLVYGDLDSVDLIEEESNKADIVCSKSHMNTK